MTETPYAAQANELRDRIIALIPDNPEILEFDSPGLLHNITGFSTEGLSVSWFQAAWALKSAQEKSDDRQT